MRQTCGVVGEARLIKERKGEGCGRDKETSRSNFLITINTNIKGLKRL